MLQAVTFNEKKRYSDVDSSTDKVAANGLTALVGGLAGLRKFVFKPKPGAGA